MKWSKLVVSALIASALFLGQSPALAAGGLKVVPDAKGIGLFFADDPKDEDVNPENLSYRLVCPAGTSDEPVGSSLLIMSADENETTAIQILKSGDSDTPSAVFQLGGGNVNAPIRGFGVEVDEMNGGWDLTLNFEDPDLNLFSTLAPLAAKGAVKLKIGKAVYDLSPAASDRRKLLDSLGKCHS